MRLLVIEKRHWTVAACIDEKNLEASVLNFLATQPPNLQASAAGFKALFERFAEQGRRGLTADMFHEASKQFGIWEFVKGQLRVYCFMDGGDRLVILSHGIVKKTQKAKKRDVERAAAVRDRYLQAIDSGTLERVENYEHPR